MVHSFSDDPEKAYAQFMQAHRCYDVIPMNAKLVILDTNLDVSPFPSQDLSTISRYAFF